MPNTKVHKRKTEVQTVGTCSVKKAASVRAVAEADSSTFELQPGEVIRCTTLSSACCDIEVHNSHECGVQAVHFTGTACLQVKYGSVSVAGRILTAEAGSVPVCADAKLGGPLTIEAVDAEVQVPRSGGKPAAISFSSQQPTAWHGCEAAEQVAPSADPASEDQTYQASPQSAATANGVQPLTMCQEWRQAAVQLSACGEGSDAAPRVAVVGSKQTGKSTFARLLVNSLLNSQPYVAFLDTDCGQSEFTPPGLVSLVLLQQPVTGPPHMHPRQPARSHFAGDTSPQINPGLFVSSIVSLLDWFAQHTAQQLHNGSWAHAPPLIINTHGWIKGAGLEMLMQVLQAARMTHLVQMQSVHHKRNLPPDASWLQPLVAHSFNHVLLPAVDALPPSPVSISAPSPGPQGLKSLSPVDSRALSWLAFARCCLDPQQLASSQPNSWDSGAFAATASALARQRPVVTSWRSLSIQVLHCAVPLSELPAAVNGTVVGLCTAPHHDAPTFSHVLNSSSDSSPLPCLGLGIVRTLDAAAGLIYILTSVDEQQLQHVNTLQVGQLHLPPTLLQAPGLQSPYLALFSLTADSSGTRSMKSRGNLLRGTHA